MLETLHCMSGLLYYLKWSNAWQSVLMFKHQVKVHHLLVQPTASKAEDEHVAMGVCAGEVLTVSGELAVKHCTMALALNLKTTSKQLFNLFLTL